VKRLLPLAALLLSAACARTDARLAARIATKLSRQPGIPRNAVAVESRDQVVTLSGTLPTPETKDAALRAARETPGVRTVVDELRIRTSPAATLGAVSANTPTSLTGDMPPGGRSPASSPPTTAGNTDVPPR
jgi:hypothetical protein